MPSNEDRMKAVLGLNNIKEYMLDLSEDDDKKEVEVEGQSLNEDGPEGTENTDQSNNNQTNNNNQTTDNANTEESNNTTQPDEKQAATTPDEGQNPNKADAPQAAATTDQPDTTQGDSATTQDEPDNDDQKADEGSVESKEDEKDVQSSGSTGVAMTSFNLDYNKVRTAKSAVEIARVAKDFIDTLIKATGDSISK